MVYQAFGGGCSDVSRYPNEHIEINARVLSVEDTNPFAKAGVMLRTADGFSFATTASAADVILDLRPDGVVELMSREAAGGPTTYIAEAAGAAPIWLKLVRNGNVVTGLMLSDGISWTTVGSAATGVSADAQMAGVVVTSHDRSRLNTSRFDHVEIRIPQ